MAAEGGIVERDKSEVSRKEERPLKTGTGRSRGARGVKAGGGSEELKRTDEGTIIKGAIRRWETPRRNVAAERWKIGGRSVMAVVVVSGGGQLTFGDLAF